MAPNPIQQIEEALFLLRSLDVRGWLQYLAASVPLLLALLVFVHDMAAGTLSNRCALESLLCSIAFFWGSAWKAKFGATLLAQRNDAGSSSQQTGFWKAFYIQGVLQTLKLFALPFAIVSVLPMAWASSFFRNATIEAGLPESTLGGVIAKSAKRASANARGQWLGMFIIWVIALLTFINSYILSALVPFLLRMISGMETDFTRYMGSLFTFNLLCVVIALTWFLIDPLLLSLAVVRCFYAEALTDGRDLLAHLRPAAVVALLLLTLALADRMSAAEPAITKDKLSSALHQAAQSEDYTWLRAQQVSKAGHDTFLGRLTQDINDLFTNIGSWFSGVKNWLKRLLEKNTPEAAPDPSSAPVALTGTALWLMYALAALVLVAAVFVVVRSRVKPEEPAIVASTTISSPDLNQENVLASDLPEEEWLRLARELLAQGELRLAVRALYLSNLSFLGAQQLIRIARSKSNSIYERELRLRPHGSSLSAPFAQSNRSFERVWYGFHEVTPESLSAFQQNVEAIRQHAKI